MNKKNSVEEFFWSSWIKLRWKHINTNETAYNLSNNEPSNSETATKIRSWKNPELPEFQSHEPNIYFDSFSLPIYIQCYNMCSSVQNFCVSCLVSILAVLLWFKFFSPTVTAWCLSPSGQCILQVQAWGMYLLLGTWLLLLVIWFRTVLSFLVQAIIIGCVMH